MEPAQWAFLMRRLLGIQMGAGGGLKESWVQRLQGFPEQGWRSAVTPVDKLLSPCMPQ